jgi:hypothetical protein
MSFGPSQSNTRPGGRGRAVLGVTLAGAVLAGGAAAVASGGAREDRVLPAETPAGGQEVIDESVVAHGSSPVAGPWEVTTYKDKDGLPCLRLMLTEAVTPISGSGWCGESDRDFLVSGLPVTTLDGQAELILFGVAPAAAMGVELIPGDAVRADVDDSLTAFGKPWVIARPVDSPAAEIGWLDEHGQRHDLRNVSSEFARAEAQSRTLRLSGLSEDG